MNRAKFSFWGAAVALALIAGCAPQAGGSPDLTGPSVSFSSDIDASVAQCRSAKKPMLLTFHTASCGWCRQLENVTFRDAEVIRLSEQFVNVRISADEESALAEKFGANGYPYTVVVNPSGTVVSRIVGYLDPPAFASQLKVALNRADIKQ